MIEEGVEQIGDGSQSPEPSGDCFRRGFRSKLGLRSTEHIAGGPGSRRSRSSLPRISWPPPRRHIPVPEPTLPTLNLPPALITNVQSCTPASLAKPCLLFKVILTLVTGFGAPFCRVTSVVLTDNIKPHFSDDGLRKILSFHTKLEIESSSFKCQCRKASTSYSIQFKLGPL